jgi:hypothetical protein
MLQRALGWARALCRQLLSSLAGIHVLSPALRAVAERPIVLQGCRGC